MQKPKKYFWKILPNEFQKILIEGHKPGQLLKLPNTIDEALRKIVGEELSELESSPAKPPMKNKRFDMVIDDEGSMQGSLSSLSLTRG